MKRLISEIFNSVREKLMKPDLDVERERDKPVAVTKMSERVRSENLGAGKCLSGIFIARESESLD